MAAKARIGAGDWAVRVNGSAGSLRGARAAAPKAARAFVSVAARASDIGFRAAGLYWAARADMKCGRPQLVEARLKNAAQLDETFYLACCRASNSASRKNPGPG